MYLDQDNISFYVGKGQDKRYKVSDHLGKNSPNPFLKNKIRKVGTANVRIQLLHKDLTEEEAFQQERNWINHYGRRDLGTGTLCNLTDGGEGSTGHVCSDEAKLKMSKNNHWRGKPGPMANKLHSKKTKEKMSGPRKPYGSQTEEHKHKVREALKSKENPMCGKPLSKEHKQKISKALKGKKLGPQSKEHKRKNSEAHKRHKVSEEVKRKISKSLKGYKCTEERKRKISEGHQRRKEKDE